MIFFHEESQGAKSLFSLLRFLAEYGEFRIGYR
jgi:hypothetical protein